MAFPFMTGPFVPVATLNLIRAVLGIHHHRFNLSVKRSRGMSSVEKDDSRDQLNWGEEISGEFFVTGRNPANRARCAPPAASVLERVIEPTLPKSPSPPLNPIHCPHPSNTF